MSMCIKDVSLLCESGVKYVGLYLHLPSVIGSTNLLVMPPSLMYQVLALLLLSSILTTMTNLQ